MTRQNTQGPASRISLSLREPVDVLTSIPYLLGYYPVDSLVVVAMRGAHVVFSVRHDLPQVGTAPRLVRQSVEYLAQAVLRQEVGAVFIVGYGSHERVVGAAFGLEAVFGRAGVTVLEVLRADGGRYWSYLCADPMCCSPDGVPYRTTDTAIDITWRQSGRTVLADRRAYEDQIAPVDGAERVAMVQATDRAHQRMVELLTRASDEEAAEAALTGAGHVAVANALVRQRCGGHLDNDEVAWLTLLFAATPIRSSVWDQIGQAREDLAVHRTLWMDVVRRAEPDLMPTPACLFAFAAWRCGEVALARLALVHAREQDPQCTMATTIIDALDRGMPPPEESDGRSKKTVRRKSSPLPRKRSSSGHAGSRPA